MVPAYINNGIISIFRCDCGLSILRVDRAQYCLFGLSILRFDRAQYCLLGLSILRIDTLNIACCHIRY